MYFSTIKRYCRWCGTLYLPRKAVYRDGFCSKAHKAALYRAYKKYVTDVRICRQTAGKIGYARGAGGEKKKLTKS